MLLNLGLLGFDGRTMFVGFGDQAGNAGHAPYTTVFMLEIVFLLLACVAIVPLALSGGKNLRSATRDGPQTSNPVEAS